MLHVECLVQFDSFSEHKKMIALQLLARQSEDKGGGSWGKSSRKNRKRRNKVNSS